jgi:hypothetical protein
VASTNARLERRIKAIPQAYRDAIKTQILISAQKIMEHQKRVVPVKTGALRASIVVTPGGTKKVAYSIGIGKARGDHELSARISAGNTNVRYAHLVEFGTTTHIAGGKFKGATIPGAAAQPYFYPPWRLGKKRFRAEVSKVVRAAGKKAAGVP